MVVLYGFNFWILVIDVGVLNWLYCWNEQNDVQNCLQLQVLVFSYQFSLWMGDCQIFQVMFLVSCGVLDVDCCKCVLLFDCCYESVCLYCYDVCFDNGIVVVIVLIDYVVLFCFEFFEGGDVNLLFDNVDVCGGLILDMVMQIFSGYIDMCSGLFNGVSCMYVVVSFDKLWCSSGCFEIGCLIGYIKFDVGSDWQVMMCIVILLILLEQVCYNLVLEIFVVDMLESVVGCVQDVWDVCLVCFDIGDVSDDQKIMLYFSLYWLYLYFNFGYENVGSVVVFDWCYVNQVSVSDDNIEGSVNCSFIGVCDGKVFVNNGFWDIFCIIWLVYVLFMLDDVGQMVQGFIEQY